MIKTGITLLAAGILTATSPWAAAQLVAFPGARGAGAYAVGGRDGNVYIVSNLNDSGLGSVRNGIDTAPASGRTIVFAVSGTIDLLSDLTIDSPFITIAGQTAPAGGISLAHRALQISNTHDVIVQHIAIRPGDFATVPNVYEPDSLWIRNSDNVTVDHVSASWSTDEVLSTTHASDQITVQWSYITEALHQSNHGDGMGGCCENHGYGGIIDGQQITYHHNLYANNRSRNPRPGGQSTDADFVNNVIYNAGDKYGYGGSTNNMDVNLIGNFAIDGPNTSGDYVFVGDSPTTRIYASGNYFDHENSANDPDGLLDLVPSGINTLGGTLGVDYVLNASRVNVGGVTVNATDAGTAYIQVLSYAGANRAYRDPIDRRILRDTINQWGDHIDSQDEVGSWHYPASQSHSLDPDGLPDDWKIRNGFDPEDNSIGFQKPTGSGYTNLELYLHELNARYVPPTATVHKAISTAYGRGADAEVHENGGLSAISGGVGTASTLNAAWGGSSGTTNQIIMLRFDLSEIVPGSIKSASLQLSAAAEISGTHSFTVYGLEHDAPSSYWDEASVQFNGAPGLVFDGNSRTLGINDLFNDASPYTYGNPANLLRLGAINLNGTLAESSLVTFTNPNLSVFLNLAAYFEGITQNGIVTIILQLNSIESASFHSKEGSLEFAPRLLVDAVLAPVTSLAGDYNQNGIVDAADYTVWRDTLGSTTNLVADGNGNNAIDVGDYNVWQQNYGQMSRNGSLQNENVPEPATLMLLLAAAGSSLLRRWAE